MTYFPLSLLGPHWNDIASPGSIVLVSSPNSDDFLYAATDINAFSEFPRLGPSHVTHSVF